MRIERVRVLKTLRVPGTPDAAAWAHAISDPAWLGGSRVLKEESPSWVRRATIAGRDVVVKGQALTRTADRVKAAAGYSRADRHWSGAAWLAMKGLTCAPVLARARASIDGADTDLLIMEFVEGPTLLGALADLRSVPVPEQHALARAVGAQVGAILNASGYNRDHKPSNILLHSRDGPTLIDCVAIRHGPFTQVSRGGERMLASLVIEPTGCGCRPRCALLWRALLASIGSRSGGRADAKAVWRRVAARMARHGDMTPRTNPLG